MGRCGVPMWCCSRGWIPSGKADGVYYFGGGEDGDVDCWVRRRIRLGISGEELIYLLIRVDPYVLTNGNIIN